jgi:hypothetical protein
MTLTDDEKAHLRAEEEFRAEMRREFAERKPSRWWTFLNSAFGLWLLGSISLGGLTFLYQRLDSSYKATTQRAEIQRKVREELRTRFAVAGYYEVADRSNSCNAESEQKQTPTPELARFILSAANGEDSGAYEEFRRVSATEMFSKLFQLDQPSDYQSLPEREKALYIARYNWIFLEPLLRLRVSQPDLDVHLPCSALSNRLKAITEKLNPY